MVLLGLCRGVRTRYAGDFQRKVARRDSITARTGYLSRKQSKKDVYISL